MRLTSFAFVAALTAAPAFAQTWPADFVTEPIGAGWDRPTCICFAMPDDNSDLFVTEKAGVVSNVRDGVKRTKPVIDLRNEVLDNGDRGLLSIQVDPDWETNGWIYLLYVVDPNGDGSDPEQESFGRLTRYTTSIDVHGDIVADPASRLVLIGATWPEGIPSLHWSHSTGDMRFGVDGSLFLTTGDGAHYDLTDSGGYDPNGFGAGKFDSSEDIGAYRSLSPTSLAGKVLRVDPATGLGLSDNPFFTGNAVDNQSRVWAMGLRNPFRFTLRPNTGSPGKLYISDVGWNSYEEINHVQQGGENFGWPCFEGQHVDSSYDNNDPATFCSNPTIFTKPLWSYSHSNPGRIGFTGQCITGAQVYTGLEYPQTYSGRLFFCEFSSDWIRTVRFVSGKPTDVELFGNDIGNPVDLIADPINGDLIYIAISDNAIRRIRYTKSNHPPVVVASATPRFGSSPLAVTFDASGSSDPEGLPLSFKWDFGDGSTDTNPAVVHVYPSGLDYTATLTVTDVGLETGSWTALISVDNTPPVIRSINTPQDGSFYTAGQLLTFDATADDAEDGAAGLPLTAEWTIDLIHDHHEHPGWAKLPGLIAQWTADSHGPGTYFVATIKVTDSRGLSATQSINLYDLEGTPHAHLVTVSDFSPRLGNEITATGHLHYPGKGSAHLKFDWGDGSVAHFNAEHFEDRSPKHTYSAPGVYTLRVSASDGDETDTVTQPILVRALHPGVAIFTPIVADHWMSATEQVNAANEIANNLRAAGFEVEIFGYSNQDDLDTWLHTYLDDGICDYLVCLDSGPSVAYAGEDDGSLAETWLDKGNGILWTGYHPFARYILPDGTDENAGAGNWAADDVLDAAIPQLCSGNGLMQLDPDASDLPSLSPYVTTRAVLLANLSAQWSVATQYASNHSAPGVMSDDLVIRNPAGGEYAQFVCKSDPNYPRGSLLSEFFLTHVYSGRPTGPAPFALLRPADHATEVPVTTTILDWQQIGPATSWLLEIARDAEFTWPVHTEITTIPHALLTNELKKDRTYYWRVTARNDYGSWTAGPFDFQSQKSARPSK